VAENKAAVCLFIILVLKLHAAEPLLSSW